MANSEVAIKENGILKYKSDKAAATVKTLGFVEGGIRFSWSYNRIPIYNNDGTLSHWKEGRKPVVSLSINKLTQDPATDLLNDAANGLNAIKVGQTVPTGTYSFEVTEADGTALDTYVFSKATLVSVNRNQGGPGQPDTLELQISAVGEPTYGSTTLA